MIDVKKFPSLQEKLYSAVICDILDEYGYRENGMKHTIRPLSNDMKLMGRAYTILATDIYEPAAEPYKLELEAVDSLKEGDVVVATTNGSVSCGFWGELLSTVAREHGARGVVLDGITRDAKRIIDMKFPAFVRGIIPYDSKGRTDVIAHQVPIVCGGVKVNHGDIIFADLDGIVVVPQEIEEEVIEKALEKVTGEDTVRKEILGGANAREVYDKYQIL